MLDGKSGDRLAERAIRVQGIYPITTTLLIPPPRATTVDVNLHWAPDKGGGELAIRSLDVRRKPDPSPLPFEAPALPEVRGVD